METWTVEKVKQQLPIVGVHVGTFVALGSISGRLNKFATVTFYVPVGGVELCVTREFAWGAIAAALNGFENLDCR